MSRSNRNTGNRQATETQAAPKATDEKIEQLDGGASNVGTDQGSEGTLSLTVPETLNEGVEQVIDWLRTSFQGQDVDAALAERFAPAPIEGTLESATPSFEIAFPLDVLAENIAEGLAAVQSALNERRAPEGTVFPDHLVGFEFQETVLDRYIRGAIYMNANLQETELVFADPEVDTTLKAINFQRMLQGLPTSFFYLRFV